MLKKLFSKKTDKQMFGVDATLDGKYIEVYIIDQYGINALIQQGYSIIRKEKI